MISTGGEEFRRRPFSPELGSGAIPGAARVELRDGGCGVVPGLEVKLRWRVARPGMERGGVATAAQLLCTAERGEAAARVRWWLARGG